PAFPLMPRRRRRLAARPAPDRAVDARRGAIRGRRRSGLRKEQAVGGQKDRLAVREADPRFPSLPGTGTMKSAGSSHALNGGFALPGSESDQGNDAPLWERAPGTIGHRRMEDPSLPQIQRLLAART